MTARVLTRRQAAEYCGYASRNAFDGLMRRIGVQAIPGTAGRYDRAAIDAALDEMAGLGDLGDDNEALRRLRR